MVCPGFPLGCRDRGVVIVVPHPRFVCVEHVDEHAIVLGEVRVAGDGKLVGDFDRARGRRAVVVDSDAWRGDGRFARSRPAAACREGGRERDDAQTQDELAKRP